MSGKFWGGRFKEETNALVDRFNASIDFDRRLYEQDTQVAITALGYLAEDRAVPGRYLLRDQPQPGGKVAALGECFSTTNRGHHCAGDDRPDTGHAHQPLAVVVSTRDGFDLAR